MGLKQAFLIHSNGDIVPVHIDDYRDIQRMVGGTFDVVASASGETSFWVNDEGKLNGMTPNFTATKILWALNPAFDGRDYLAGPVLITGGADEEGETLSVGREAETAVMAAGKVGNFFDSIGL